jgi:hypothetical protein
MTWRAYTDLTRAQLRLYFLLGQNSLTERSRNTERRLHQKLACIVQNLKPPGFKDQAMEIPTPR